MGLIGNQMDCLENHDHDFLIFKFFFRKRLCDCFYGVLCCGVLWYSVAFCGGIAHLLNWILEKKNQVLH